MFRVADANAGSRARLLVSIVCSHPASKFRAEPLRVRRARFQSVTTEPHNAAVTIDFDRTRLQPTGVGTEHQPVARIAFNASGVTDRSQLSGRIVVASKGNRFRVQVRYEATVLSG